MAGTINIAVNGAQQGSPSDFDELLLQALKNPRDRQLLFRADAVIESFVEDVASLRLRLEPPVIPILNSFQRMLVHKLADTYGISRTIEQSNANGFTLLSPTDAGSSNPPTSQTIMTLVKTAQTCIPNLRLAQVADTVVVEASTTKSRSEEYSLQNGAQTGTTTEQLPSRESPNTTSTTDTEQPVHVPSLASTTIRIMSREGSDGNPKAPSPGAATAVSAGRKVLSLQEREAAYALARERIFKEDIKAVVAQASGLSLKQATEHQALREKERRDSPDSSRPSSPATKQRSQQNKAKNTKTKVMSPANGTHSPLSASTSLRPSAPAFDPTAPRYSPQGGHFLPSENGQPYYPPSLQGPENYMPHPYPMPPPGYYYPEHSAETQTDEFSRLDSSQMRYPYVPYSPYAYPVPSDMSTTPIYDNGMQSSPVWPYPPYFHHHQQASPTVRSPTGEAVYRYLQTTLQPGQLPDGPYAYPPSSSSQRPSKVDHSDRLETGSACSSQTASSFSHSQNSLARLDTASTSSSSSIAPHHQHQHRSPIKESSKVSLGKGLPDLTRMRDTHNSKLKAKRRLASSRASSVSSRNDTESVSGDFDEPRELHRKSAILFVYLVM